VVLPLSLCKLSDVGRFRGEYTHAARLFTYGSAVSCIFFGIMTFDSGMYVLFHIGLRGVMDD